MTENRNPLLQFIERLPVLGDYRDRERRREIDRRLREGLAQALERARRHLTDIQKEILRTPGGLHWMDDIERLHSRLLLLIDEIRTTVDGYRALFDLEQVDARLLERLREFDVAFAQTALTLEERIKALREVMHQSPEAFREALEALFEKMTTLVDTYEKREELIRHPQAQLPAQDKTDDPTAEA